MYVKGYFQNMRRSLEHQGKRQNPILKWGKDLSRHIAPEIHRQPVAYIVSPAYLDSTSLSPGWLESRGQAVVSIGKDWEPWTSPLWWEMRAPLGRLHEHTVFYTEVCGCIIHNRQMENRSDVSTSCSGVFFYP